MTLFSDVFISYGRIDSQNFVTKLTNELAAQGLEVWVDFEDIPLGVAYQEYINDGIDNSDNFLFIISPHSVNSEYCSLELELAIKRNKRIIPLMHIEEISQETWQIRHPNDTEKDWENYKLKGKHVSKVNMHPLISKINWIYFREDQDVFESSFQGLLNLIKSHKSQTRCHTQLLVKALAWERHQKETQYLLFGEERKQAENWLAHSVTAEKPAYIPSDLHCEFITESTKNANNLMTQVFVTYANEDQSIAERIRYGLLRAGITVWNKTYDIETGQDFQIAIDRGIESADNLVFLVSPESLKSIYCQHKLTYAQSLNKRIIPLLTRRVYVQDMPLSLQSLQHINLTDNLQEHDYIHAGKQLLRVLHKNENYYRDHKTLLVKALKWERQQHNPGILLRGYDLRAAEAWLKTAQRRENNLPTQIQTEFIEESLRQPPDASLDVFISYSRSDSEFARKLNNTLQKHGKKTWFDQESIAAGTEDFEQEIYRGIEKSDNFIFVLSPRAVKSPYCYREVAHAANLNKRFITVLYRDLGDTPLNPELAKVQWIDFSQSSENFYTGFNQMIRILETDRDHVQRHTQLSLKALEWKQKNQSPDVLIRGGELESAQIWYQEAQSQHKQPPSTKLQIDYLDACQQAHQTTIKKEEYQQKVTKVLLGMMTLAFLGALGLFVYANSQTRKANTALQGQIGLLSDQSHSLVKNGQELDALVQATHAGKLLTELGETKPELQEDVSNALGESLAWVKARNRVKAHDDEIKDMSIRSDGQIIATAGDDNTVKIWNRNGQLLNTLKHGSGVIKARFTENGKYLVTQSRGDIIHIWTTDWKQKLRITYPDHKEDDIWSIDISPNGRWVAIGSKKGQLKVWSLATGTLVKSFFHGRAVGGVRFSPDSNSLASWDNQNTFKLWSREGQLQHTLEHSNIWEVIFSPNGETLATRSEDGTIKLWSTTGQNLQTEDLGASVYEFAFSQDSQFLAAGTSSGTLQLWQVKDAKLLLKTFDEYTSDGFTRTAHEGKITSIRFGPDNKTLITAGGDYTVKVWGLNGQELHRFKHQSEVWEAKPSPDKGDWIASYDNERILRIWDLTQQTTNSLKEHDQLASRVSFSSDQQTIGTSGLDGRLNLWDRQGTLLTTLTEESGAIKDFQFSTDGQTVLIGSTNKTAKLFNLSGQLLREFKHDAAVAQISLSPTGKLIATWQNNALVKLWSLEGKLLHTAFEQYSPKFSSKGDLLLTATAGNVHLWQIEGQGNALSEKCVMEGPSKPHIVRNFHLSSNEQTLLTANSDGTARQWTMDCKQVMTFPHGNSDVAVRDAVASEDGEMILTVGSDNTIKIWSPKGDLINTLHGHTAMIFQVLFNPDGQSFATAANDQTVRIWSLEGELLRTLWHPNEIQRMRYSLDGKQLLVAHGQTPTLWNLDSEVLKLTAESRLDSLMTQACTWLGPYLEREGDTDRDRDLCQSN